MSFREGDLCPVCKVGRLKIKQGRYSQFLGCDMFRDLSCNFMSKLDKDESKNALELQADAILRQHNKEYLIL